MAVDQHRRRFLTLATAGGALAGLGDLGFLSRLPQVSAAESKLELDKAPCRPEIEPIVRLVEETPRSELLEQVAARIAKGLSYREVLAALFLAGVRNVEPRPSVGFKFHAVLVVNSAHLASMASPAEHRWLPIFWALDYFKSSQARDARENREADKPDWALKPVDESRVPSSSKAARAFTDAMDNWDEQAADAAVAALARTRGASEVFELFFKYGSRDFRSIGHKAIFVSNSWRTLQCIGWRHAEPVLRSLAYALLMHEGGNPARRDDDADRPGRENTSRAQSIRADWLDGKLDDGATGEMMAALRSGTSADACDKVVELLNRGVAPQSVWDALLCESGELLVRQPGIVGLHTLTTSNSLRFAYQATGDDQTRRMLLLQNAAFLPMFRQAMHGRGKVGEFKLAELETSSTSGNAPEQVEAIFADVSGDRMSAASRVLAYLEAGNSAEELIEAARVMVFLKGRDSHDYKFSSAVLEDYYNLSPNWRNRYLAASVFNLKGSRDRDNSLVERTRAALNG